MVVRGIGLITLGFLMCFWQEMEYGFVRDGTSTPMCGWVSMSLILKDGCSRIGRLRTLSVLMVRFTGFGADWGFSVDPSVLDPIIIIH